MVGAVQPLLQGLGRGERFDRDEGRQDMWNVLKLDVCCPLGSTKRPSPGLMDRTEGRRLSMGDHRKSFPEHEESNRALSLLSYSF